MDTYSPVVSRFTCATIVLCVSAWLGSGQAQIPLAPQRIVVANELSLNSTGLEYPVAILPAGLVYVSTQSDVRLKKRLRPVRRGKNATERLVLAVTTEDGALDAQREYMTEFGKKVNAGPLTFNSDSSIAYVTRNAGAAKSKSRVAARLQIYETTRLENGEWGSLRSLEFADATSNDAHPSLAADESLMIFASDRDGGYGGLDLWGVRRGSGMWGVPFNLGSGVNTGGNEAFPFLHADGTLYFATTVAGKEDGPAHLDLAYSKEVRGEWEEPTFLGAPFNGPGDDFALLVGPNNEQGYFASQRDDGLGDDDIYRFEIVGLSAADRRQAAEMAVVITDAETGAPLQGASVVYLDADTTSLASALAREVVTVDGKALQVVGGERYRTDVNGEGIIGVREGTFLLEVAREGYAPVVLQVAVSPGQTEVPIALSRKLACAEVRISVVEEKTVFPVVGALLAATSVLGQINPPEARTGEDGTVVICLPCGELYEINALAGSKLGTSIEYDATGSNCGLKGPRTTLTLYVAETDTKATRTTEVEDFAEGTPLAAGTKFQMPAVYYALNDFRLNEAAKSDLDDLGRLMRQFPEMEVELGSHTDANGPAAFNRNLSQRRAEEARQYLITQTGIEANRIVAVGYGESRLRNGCRDGVSCTAAQHRANRRTEVTILGDKVRPTLLPPVAPAENRGTRSQPRLTANKTVIPQEANRRTSFLVISGVFSSESNADNSANELRLLGYEGVVVEEVTGVAGFAVVAARYRERQQAAQFARALREAHGRAAYVKPN